MAEDNQVLLEATQIKKSYKITKEYSLQVLKGIDLQIKSGEIAAIVGKSGAGKSTLLHILGTLDTPDSGELFFDSQKVFSYSQQHLADFRNKEIGFIFQFHHLLPEFTVLENILIPSMISGKRDTDKARSLLKEVGLLHRADHKPSEISGGEAQRAAIARALINSPKIILADEPTGNLDTENANSIIELIFGLRKKFNQTFVIVTHNEEFAKNCDRIIKMKDGLISDII
ncbi:MAG TPA: ABC transporter ATP-binding protein [Ignavibacteria bacterium]|nr:ABC transporter ATP-binding protein [Ignavibacteria bacterium]